MQGVEREKASFKSKFADEMLGNRNLIRLLVGNHLVPEDDLVVSEKRGKHLNHLLILEMIEAAFDRLAIKSDLDVRVRIERSQLSRVRSERFFQSRGVCSLYNISDRGVARRFLPAEIESLFQDLEMCRNEHLNLPVRISIAHDREQGQTGG